MINFSIKAFVTGCKAVMTSGENREQENLALVDPYCAYLQQLNVQQQSLYQ